MGAIIVSIGMAGIVASFIFALIYVVPIVNRALSCIWEDPTEQERKMVLKRLKELHVDGNIPEETAVVIASAERNVPAENVKELVGMMGSRNLMGVLSGKKSLFWTILDGIEKQKKKGTEKRRR